MFHNVYKGKKVFVTGHTGFKGSWLCAWLLSMGAEVTGYSFSIPTNPSHFEAMGLADHIHDIRGDVRDRDKLVASMQEAKPDIVFHLAAQALVRLSYDKPVETFESNVMGTMNVCEAVRLTPSVKSLVLITSDKCYRNDEHVWGYRENDHLGGFDPYSASKGCAEIVAHSYFRSFFAKNGPAAATVRAGNVIGGGDWALDRIVPDCARAWSEDRPVVIRSPHATRPWQLVLEPLSGYLWLAALLYEGDTSRPFNLAGEAYNFGPAADVNNPVSDLVQALAQHWPGFCSEMDLSKGLERKECTLLKLCCDKALAYLNWKATLTFDETIRYTAEWYQRYYKGGGREESMLDFTLGQIAAYTNAAQMRSQVWSLDEDR